MTSCINRAASPAGSSGLRVVVEGPAELWQLSVPPELVARLVDDTVSGEALPLLAFALARLTENVGHGGTLSLSAYESMGG